MKKILLLLILAANIIYAQPEEDVLDYYPLQTGNYREYEHIHSEPHSEHPVDIYDTTYFSIEVIGDTVMSNDQTYKILLKKFIPDTADHIFYYERVDTSSANVYRYIEDEEFDNNEYLLDSLKAQEDDVFYAYRNEHFDPDLSIDFPPHYCTGHIKDTILGVATSSKLFDNRIVIPHYQYKLTKGFGLSGASMHEISGFQSTLIYADIDGRKYGSPVSVSNSEISGAEMHLRNYPNPLEQSTTIEFFLPSPSDIELSLYDPRGRKIRTIASGIYVGGNHSIKLSASGLQPGVYYYVFRSGRFSEARKCIVLK